MKVTASFIYDEGGAAVARFDRIEPGFGGVSKAFLPYLADGRGGFNAKPGLSGVELPLYRIDEVRAAIAAGDSVIFTEGEGKGDVLRSKLRANGSQAAVTTIFGGANGRFRQQHLAALAGSRQVIVLADSDDSGRHAAKSRAQRIVDAYSKCDVRIIDLFPTRNDGSDVKEFLEEGHSIAQLLELISDAPRLDPSPLAPLPIGSRREAGIITTQLSRIEPRKIKWRWSQRIPCGAFGLVAGAPGVGKSFIASVIAGAWSTGRALPGDKGQCYGAADVLLMSFEDDAATVMRPRFDSLESNLERIHIVEGVLRDDGSKDSFELADVQLLEQKLDQLPGISLVVIDPISSRLGHIDTWRSPQVRAVLDPFLEKCAARAVTVLAVIHTTKRSEGPAIFKIEGSLGAFVGRARFVLGVGANDEGRRGVAVLKSNYGPTDSVPVIEYEINPAGEFYWLGETNELDVSGLFTTSPLTADGRSELEDAKDSIRGALAAGRIIAAELAKRVKADGVADVTFRRARSDLRRRGEIQRTGGGVAGPVLWKLAIESQGYPQKLIRKRETERDPVRQSAEEVEAEV